LLVLEKSHVLVAEGMAGSGTQAIPPAYSEYIAKQYDLSLEVPNGKH